MPAVFAHVFLFSSAYAATIEGMAHPTVNANKKQAITTKIAGGDDGWPGPGGIVLNITIIMTPNKTPISECNAAYARCAKPRYLLC